MAQFRYRALDAAGIAVRGRLDAAGPDDAVSQLQAQGLLVLQVASDARWGAWGLRSDRPAMRGSALARFTRQLAILLDAGQPIDRALGILLAQPGDEGSRRVVERIRDGIKGGKPLSSALVAEGSVFPPLYLAMARAGEAGGSLAPTLAQLATYLERVEALKGEVINALIYPAFLVVGVLGALAMLMVFVVPQFVPIFQDLGAPVPAVTQAVLWLSDFLVQYGLVIGATAIAATWWMLVRLRDPERRTRWDRRMLTLRVIGPLLQRLETARLARTLGTLLENGVPMLAALALGAKVCANRALRAAVTQAGDRVKDGGALAAALGASGLFPALALQMIQVGEESGRLDHMLMRIADVFDAEAGRSIARLLAALVPTLTIVMAVMVALVMLAIMLPLMSLTSSI